MFQTPRCAPCHRALCYRVSDIPLCPSEGVTRESAGSTSCYTLHVQPATWYEAASLCRGQGATTGLLTVTSQAEQDFIVAAIKNDSGKRRPPAPARLPIVCVTA